MAWILPPRWTWDEYRRMQELFADGLRIAAVAKVLGRSVDSVKYRRRMPMRPPRPPKLTAEDALKIKGPDLATLGLSIPWGLEHNHRDGSLHIGR